MIELKQGDILRANAEALVNTVNCVGVMGRGLALQFKKVFPDNFKSYKALCDNNELQPGKMFTYDLNRLYNPRYVVNFPTKRHWKGKSRMEDIEAGLQALVAEVHKRDIHSIAIPPLGCGLGGLCWGDVRARIKEAFQDLPDVQVLIYEPKGAWRSLGCKMDQNTQQMTTINRFSSRRQSLDHAFLADRLRGAKSYKRIAGYFRQFRGHNTKLCGH